MLNPAPSHSAASPTASPSRAKRPYRSDESPLGTPYPQHAHPISLADSSIRHPLPAALHPAMSTTGRPLPFPSSAASFRNVSACNRCRLRKNRCDQRLPRCQSCEKARVHCVGYDPTTKREIPRSYVFFLESRVEYLERLLSENGIEFRAAEAFEGEEELGPVGANRNREGTSAGGDAGTARLNNTRKLSRSAKPATNGRETVIKQEKRGHGEASILGSESAAEEEGGSDGDTDRKRKVDDTNQRLDNLVSNISMVSVQGTSDSRYLGSTSGISFAGVVFAAVRSSVFSNASERGATRSSERVASGNGTSSGSSLRDSFFGLQTRPMMRQAPFPEQELAEGLIDLYFEHANPQIPILHREDFMELFKRVYSTYEKSRSHRDLYLLNIVCAIGAGIILDPTSDPPSEDQANTSPTSHSQKRQKLLGKQYQPEEYHASALVHLESFLGSSPATDGFGGVLEELQAVLLLASFALLRPVAPGLWYIVGVAVRLAIDLGLHYEDGTGLDAIGGQEGVARRVVRGDSAGDESTENLNRSLKVDARERGRREWVRDLRRRLWWCVYAFDRLVSTCVGRPFGITDQVITTEFPSLLDDKYITKSGFLTPPDQAPSYKHVAYHYCKLRLLQSEIQQVLQHRHARMVRQVGKERGNAFMHTNLPSPFLQNFDSFYSWRRDIHRRLTEWRAAAPKPQDIGVKFSVDFLELNYWQALVMLYQQSLSVPPPLAGEMSPTEDVSSPSMANIEDGEDEEEIYVKVAEAGQQVLRLYRRLHRIRLVNYTFLATHHLFMAGISFLYAIWHSPAVRSHLTLDAVDFTIYCATSVLEGLMHKCPPAEACRDALNRMSAATVQMCLSTTGFGSIADTASSGLAPVVGPWASSPTSGSESPRSYGKPANGQQSAARFEGNVYSQTYAITSRPFGSDIHGDGAEDSREQRREQASGHYRGGYSDQPIDHLRPDQYSLPQYPLKQSGQRFPSAHVYPYDDANSPHQYQQDQYAYLDTFRRPSANNNSQHQYRQPSQPDFSGTPGLDFLDGISSPGPGVACPSSVAGDTDGNEDANMTSVPPPRQGGSTGTGLDLGFGISIDFQHDWSDGQGYDLFDGFWFGGAT